MAKMEMNSAVNKFTSSQEHGLISGTGSQTANSDPEQFCPSSRLPGNGPEGGDTSYLLFGTVAADILYRTESMKLGDLINFDGAGFIIYPAIIQVMGLKEAVFLCRIIWWQKAPEQWIEKSIGEVKLETGLSGKEQRAVRSRLETLGVIEQEYHRLSHILRFRIKAVALEMQLPSVSGGMCPKGTSESPDPEHVPEGQGHVPKRQGACAQKALRLYSEEVQEYKNKKGFVKPSMDEVKAFCIQIGLQVGDGESFFYGKEGNGWMNGKVPVKDWKATIQNWKSNGFMPSQKANGNTYGKNQVSSANPRNAGICRSPLTPSAAERAKQRLAEQMAEAEDGASPQT